MEPVEINAGAWYLRALRADERIDDRPALADGGITDPNYVPQRTEQWARDTHYSWAVCEPTTAELVAEIGITPTDAGTAELTSWCREGFDTALTAGLTAVQRFAEQALDLATETAERRP